MGSIKSFTPPAAPLPSIIGPIRPFVPRISIDLPSNNIFENNWIETPSVSDSQAIIDPEMLKVIERLAPGRAVNDAMIAKHRIVHHTPRKNMLRIRSAKMNKHKLRKRRKKYLSVILRTRMKKEIAKEKLFRAELLSQIREAEKFDAKAYVHHVLSTISKKPREKTRWEITDELYEKKRKNRFNVDLIKPEFDDPVP